jgi:hypothetical protein
MVLKYEPSSDVSAMHNMPRLAGSNEFPVPPMDATDGQNYVVGVVLTGVVFFLFAILSIPCLCCYMCCCIKNQRNKDLSGSAKWKKKVQITMLVTFVIYCIGVLVSLAGNIMTSDGVEGMLDLVVNLVSLIDKAIRLLTDIGEISVLMGEQTTSIASSCVPAAPSVSSINRDLGSLKNATEDFIDITKGTTSLTGDFEENTKGFDDPRRSATNLLITFYFLLGMGFAFLFAAQTIWKEKTGIVKLSRCLGKVLSLFSVGMIMFAWLIAGFSIILSTFMSDLCYDPNGVINGAMGSSSGGDMIRYYQTCVGQDDPTAESLSTITDVIQTTQTSVDGMRTSLTEPVLGVPALCPQIVPELDEMDDLLDDVRDKQKEAQDAIGCEGINRIYGEFIYDTLCGSIVGALIRLWVGCFLCAANLTIGMIAFRKYTARMVALSEQNGLGGDDQNDQYPLPSAPAESEMATKTV